MSKHTPGPWKVEAHKHIEYGDTKYCSHAIKTDDSAGFQIATVMEDFECDAEANARLIAAAPELLEACEALSSIEHIEQTSTGPLRDALLKARAAIAKAKRRASMSNPIMKHEECWSALQLAALASAMAGRSVFEFEGRKWAVSGIVGRDVTFTEIDQAKVPEPSGWTGEGLPPVGIKVVLDDSEYEIFNVYKEMIGVEVLMLASFKSPAGFDMIACALPDGLCGAFRAEMAKPVPTPEQIAAEDLEKGVEEIRRLIAGLACEQAANVLYDAGYRKQEQPK